MRKMDRVSSQVKFSAAEVNMTVYFFLAIELG